MAATSDGMGTALPVSPSRWFGPSVGPNETASPVSEWVVVETALSISLPPPLVLMTTGKIALTVSMPGGGETALSVSPSKSFARTTEDMILS